MHRLVDIVDMGHLGAAAEGDLAGRGDVAIKGSNDEKTHGLLLVLLRFWPRLKDQSK